MKLKTGSKEWLRQLKNVVLAECPPLVECRDCGRVIREGFCCLHCGSKSPGQNEVDAGEWLWVDRGERRRNETCTLG